MRLICVMASLALALSASAGMQVRRPPSFSAAAPICGDSVRNGSDECDGSDFGSATCATYSCSGGSLTCTGSCVIDSSSCTGCPTADLLDETFDATGYDQGACGTQPDCWTEIFSLHSPDSTVNPPLTSVTGFSGQMLRFRDTADNGPYVYYQWTGGAQTKLYCQVYFYMDASTGGFSIENGARENYMMMEDATSGGSVIDTTAGSIQINVINNAGTYQLCLEVDDDACNIGMTVALNTGYRVAWKWDDTADANAYELRVDGVTIGSGTAAAALSPTRLVLGMGAPSANTTRTVYFDKAQCSSTGWLGP